MLYIGNFLLSRYFVQGINTTYVMSDQSLKKINRRSVDIAPRNIHFLTSTIFIISQFVFL